MMTAFDKGAAGVSDNAAADEAFEQLEALHARLPAMQEAGERLARAREARRFRELERHSAALEREWERLNTECKALMIEERELRASDEGGEERLGLLHAKIRYLSEIIAVKRAPLEQARVAKDAAWSSASSASFAPDAPLDELALPDEEFLELEQSVTTFQQEYTAAYERCLSFE
jgi:predicted DNA-binding WGR domain protein